MPERRAKESKNYRRGLILGFTIAEIVLLVLFALLMALAQRLISGKKEVLQATALNSRFMEAVASMDDPSFQKKLNAAIQQEIDYQKRLEDAVSKISAQSLPDDVYAEIKSQKIDLNTKEGKQRFLDLVSTALEAEREAAKSGGTTASNVAAACRAGSEFKKVLGDKDPSELINTTKDAVARAEHYKSEAAKCGLSGNLPACFRGANDPIPYLYEVRIKPEGLQLKLTLPNQYVERFNSNFTNSPDNAVLSVSDFRAQAKQFLDWGDRNQCRFYVTVYDDLPNDKERFKSMLKTVEGYFYKRQTW